MKGSLKVVGVLEGWPFPVQSDPTVVNPQAIRAAGVLRLLQKVFEK